MNEKAAPAHPSTPKLMAALRVELSRERAGKRISGAKIARWIGVAATTVSGWFTGTAAAPRVDHLFDLCEVLGVDPAEMIKRAAERAAERAAKHE